MVGMHTHACRVTYLLQLVLDRQEKPLDRLVHLRVLELDL
jgi:hypothetical protein